MSGHIIDIQNAIDCSNGHEAQKSCYYTLLHVTRHITILEPFAIASLRVMDYQVSSKLIYETLPGKEVVYVLPITSILGTLPGRCLWFRQEIHLVRGPYC